MKPYSLTLFIFLFSVAALAAPLHTGERRGWTPAIGENGVWQALEPHIVNAMDAVAWVTRQGTPWLEHKAYMLQYQFFYKAPEWLILDVWNGRFASEEAGSAMANMVDKIEANLAFKNYDEDEINFLKVIARKGKDNEAVRQLLANQPGDIRQIYEIDEALKPLPPKIPKAKVAAGAVAGVVLGGGAVVVEETAKDN